MGKKLILPTNVEFPEYKGFVIKVEPVDDEYIGVAVNNDVPKVVFTERGETRNEVGKKLEGYVDIYRKNQKQKLVIK